MQRSITSNNFDFLRLAAAYLVLLSHQFALAGRDEQGIGVNSLGGLGVAIFFSISGYLVAQSWVRDPSVWRFLAKRVLRIWPGLIAVTAAAALLLGPLVSTLPLDQYFLSPQTWDFFRTLKLTIRYELPGVFSTNPYANAVNGSLWTLPIEFRCYLILMVLGLIGLFRHRYLLLICAIAFAVYVFVIDNAQYSYHRNLKYEFGAFFFYGACLHCFRDFWMSRMKTMLLAAGTGATALFVVGQEYAALFLVLPALVVFFGEKSTPWIRHAGRFGDFSYGVYIYAFPVQQTVVFLTANSLPIWSALAISTTITIALAFLSWHLIESPALHLKRHLSKPADQRVYSDTSRCSKPSV